LLCNILMYF